MSQTKAKKLGVINPKLNQNLPVWDKRDWEFGLEPCKAQKLKLLKTQLEWVYDFVYVLEHAFVLLETSEYSGLAYRLDVHLSVLLLQNKHFSRSIKHSGHIDVGDKWILVTLCWWLFSDVGYRILILVTSFGCWCPTLMLKDRRCCVWWQNRPKPSPTSQSRRQHISSPTFVTNINVTAFFGRQSKFYQKF